MSTSYSVRRLSAAEIPTHLDSLCDVLTDCVEGGASVSFFAAVQRGESARFLARCGPKRGP